MSPSRVSASPATNLLFLPQNPVVGIFEGRRVAAGVLRKRDNSLIRLVHKLNAKVAREFDGIASLRLGGGVEAGIAFIAEGANFGSSIKILPLKSTPEPVCASLGSSVKRSLEEWKLAFLKALRS
tara:strand:- start:195 stop:569 length:375 start_codon:yes stop_codon:yes gene_type:complete